VAHPPNFLLEDTQVVLTAAAAAATARTGGKGEFATVTATVTVTATRSRRVSAFSGGCSAVSGILSLVV